MNSSGEEGQQIGLRAGLKIIFARMSPPRQRQFFIVLVLMFAGAIAELATIGAVIPFLTLLPDARASVFPFNLSSGDPRLVAAAAFILIALVAGLVRLELARSSRNFIFRLGHELTVEIQRRVLLQPFSFHIERNTSTLLAALSKNEALVFDVLLPFMYAATGGAIALSIFAILVFVAPLTTLSVAAAFALTYAAISAVTRRRLAANSAVLDSAFDERLEVVQESLGGIRDVIIDNSQAMYLREFETIDLKLAVARSTTQFISIAPRYLIETIGMVLIAVIALVASQRAGGIAAALPMLGALALGAQRLLPLVQEVYGGWSRLEGQRSIFSQIMELLCLPVGPMPQAPATALELRDGVTADQVKFRYPSRHRPALDEITMEIPRGSMLALVGPTGSGKSTLVDVLMGLLPPDSGRILVDGVPLGPETVRQWHRSIAHVPQSIFLADSTIARNIALSVPDAVPDRERIMDSARRAQLHDFVVSLAEGYETLVGERGVRLSGGQRQRLGIARAIYKQAPVLFFDEATSALDDVTESAVMGALDELRREGRTIIIVAHRLSTIRHCDLVARLDKGELVELGLSPNAFAAPLTQS